MSHSFIFTQLSEKYRPYKYKKKKLTNCKIFPSKLNKLYNNNLYLKNKTTNSIFIFDKSQHDFMNILTNKKN